MCLPTPAGLRLARMSPAIAIQTRATAAVGLLLSSSWDDPSAAMAAATPPLPSPQQPVLSESYYLQLERERAANEREQLRAERVAERERA